MNGQVLPPVDLTAKQINENHSAVMRAAKSVVTGAIAAGEALIKAKAAVPDSTWLNWLNRNSDAAEKPDKRNRRIASEAMPRRSGFVIERATTNVERKAAGAK